VSLRARALRLHRRLIPEPYLGWAPYLWLFYLSGFFVPWFGAPLRSLEFALALLSTGLFLLLYFDGYRRSGRRLILDVAGILALGIAWLPFNAGAMTFFIYAGAFLGGIKPARLAYRYLVAIVAILLLEWWALDVHWSVGVFGVPITALVSLTNIHYAEVRRKDETLRRTQQEVRRLATVAERERIARDLHDLLGHTLSVITLKAELAGRLLARRDDRALQEIRDVERISRDALGQVREAVSGYRAGGLAEELENARLACEAAGIELKTALPPLSVGAEREPVLALALREAVTNVVRHSRGRHCRIELQPEADQAVLTVEDDGQGAVAPPGAGLLGMRQRLETAGGSLDLRSGPGFTLVARVPLGTRRREQPA